MNNDPQLDIYYRISERDDWAFLGSITPALIRANVNARRDYPEDTSEEGVPEQTYQFTKLPDGSPLPEFNEIQFKFVSKRGFSVIAAWFSYSYLTRNTLS